MYVASITSKASVSRDRLSAVRVRTLGAGPLMGSVPTFIEISANGGVNTLFLPDGVFGGATGPAGMPTCVSPLMAAR